MRLQTLVSNKVTLHVYDLNPEQNEMLYQFGLGLYHSGVSIGGQEWTFAGGGGIFSHAPKEAQGARFREAIDMGVYAGTSRELERILNDLRDIFKGENYHILTMNCNSFSEALLHRLVNKPLPGFVNRMAYLGSFFSCLLPPQIGNEAPVNSSSSAGGRTASRISGFCGSGKKLISNPTNPGVPATAESLADQAALKEKVRRAALSRMQQQPMQYG